MQLCGVEEQAAQLVKDCYDKPGLLLQQWMKSTKNGKNGHFLIMLTSYIQYCSAHNTPGTLTPNINFVLIHCKQQAH